MEIRKEDIAMDVMRFIAKHGITTYANMIIININPNTKDAQDFLDLIGTYNTIINLESKQNK